MNKPIHSSPVVLRDGESQSMRRRAALDPSYARVDERSAADLLLFARAYGKELIYYKSDDSPDGDWSALLDPSVDIDQFVRLVEGEGEPLEGRSLDICRPHVALFLTFLRLLRHAQEAMNTITRRHLDFYYGSVLGMSRRAPTPDQVNVIVKLGRGAAQVLLPAGTLLDAGKDSQGKDVAYRTDRDIVISRAQIERLSSVHVERHVTSIRGAREEHPSDKDAALLAALSIALGDPSPGDPLPPYNGAQPVDAALLSRLHALVTFARTHLFLELYELGALMRLLHEREEARGEWNQINGYLKAAARARLGDPTFAFEPANPRDFKANVASAVGGEPNFGTLPDVASLDDLFEKRDRKDVRDFIAQSLYFADINEFVSMMRLKMTFDSDWSEINRIIEAAGRRKRGDAAYTLSPVDPAAFDQNLDAAVGPVDFSSLGVSTFSAYMQELAHVEEAFYMPADDFAYMMAVHEADAPTEKELSQVDEILADAHERKVYTARRARLKQIGKSAVNPEDGLRAVLTEAVGAEFAAESALELALRMRGTGAPASDIDFLQSTAMTAVSASVVTDASWDRVIDIVVTAQRAAEGFARPVAQKVEWLDIHPYEDATSVISGVDVGAESAAKHWKTFGAARPEVNQDAPPPPVLGWAIQSPILALSEGKRSIALTLGFEQSTFNDARVAAALARGPFTLKLSTAKGLRDVTAVAVEQGDYQALSGVSRALPSPLRALKLTLEIGADADPVAGLPEGGASRAELRLMLRPVWDPARGRFTTPYEPFNALVLAAAHIKVEARGMTALALENDRGALDPKKPFEPFGMSPSVGSRFYAGHPELSQKSVDDLRFHVEWMNAPESLQAHYAAYGITADFRARVSLRDRAREIVLANEAPLFDAASARALHTIEILGVPETLQANDPTYVYERAPDAKATGDAVSAWSRYLVWELAPRDFQHRAYPDLVAAKAAEMNAAIAARGTGSPPIDVSAYRVNPPYTPVVKRITLDYTSSAEVRLDLGGAALADRVFHIHPFGRSEAAAQPGHGAPLLPSYDLEGELYLGIRDADPPQRLSILFQMAEGSADGDLEPAAVEWSYLSGDRWLSLHNGSILSDGTRGLMTTGIIELSLGRTEPSARMPGELTWLRAAVRCGARSVSDVIGVHTQAVSATFVDRGNAPDHYGAPLPPASITKLVEPQRRIAGVEQPYPSYGGRAAEGDEERYARISERLRHKGRGLSIWDYEHLVLERFPEIYKAKCLPANVGESPDEMGKVTIIVIPYIRGQVRLDTFEAKAPAATLAEIEEYLADKTPPSASIEARNAHFIAVKVRVEVRFSPGSDEGFYKRKLSEELCRFLSPWAFTGGVDIAIGDRIYAHSIVDFVDRRPYIDFVAGITLFRSEGGRFVEIKPSADGGTYVSADRPDGVLVTAPDHEIDTSWQEREAKRAAAALRAAAAAQATGIGHTHVGRDFIIKDQAPAEAGLESMVLEIDFKVA